ncbi:nucleotidyltransferase family protein [Nitrososphaera viennensis]|uniref:Nucleotidyl-transferase n=2 Tax=Nitrososphaera viennensis TaxID=1034015 RepID=A0A060HHV8_9ARCH|nr:nucleotidyltransferase family protein [Nitrososphaera viennensis]AIC14885.1 nucleotidyl-transferase [Nitrososphaera viennensis EN76]UVS69831.1 nucleotidyltransferase family protein [Nitrososphaera viennensis]
MKAVILAGGLGTRLQPYTFFIPKPMLPLGNKPLLEYTIEWLRNAGGIKEIVICVSYLHRTIEDYFEDGSRFNVKIDYARAERPLATAGQLKTAEKMLADDTFVCVYGDSVYEFNLRKMLKMHSESKAFVSMALMHYSTKLKYGFIDVDGSDITGWREKPEISGLINIGCYVMEPGFLKAIPKAGAFGMDDAVRNALAQKKKVKAFEVDGTGFIDIGDKKSYLDAYKQFASRLGKI